MKIRVVLVFIISAFLLVIYIDAANADEWRYPTGISYVTQFQSIADNIEDNLIATKETDTDPGALPFGFSFQPYLQFDNGMRIGTGVSPLMYTYGAHHYTDIPININIGYTFNLPSTIAPYLRFGFIQHVVVSDFFISSYPGLIGAVGIEFFRNSSVGLGVELSYDFTTIKMERKRTVKWYDIRGYNIISTYLREDSDIFKSGPSITLYAVF